jgi:hypothetical protein
MARSSPLANPERYVRLRPARAYYDDDTWQSVIAQLMNEALFIVLVVGAGQGLRWELRHVLTQGHAHKLIVLFPFLASYHDQRLAWFHDVFDGTDWQTATQAPDLHGAVALHLTARGRLVAIWTDNMTPLRAAILGHTHKPGTLISEYPSNFRDPLNRTGPDLEAALDIAIYGVLCGNDRRRRD